MDGERQREPVPGRALEPAIELAEGRALGKATALGIVRGNATPARAPLRAAERELPAPRARRTGRLLDPNNHLRRGPEEELMAGISPGERRGLKVLAAREVEVR